MYHLDMMDAIPRIFYLALTTEEITPLRIYYLAQTAVDITPLRRPCLLFMIQRSKVRIWYLTLGLEAITPLRMGLLTFQTTLVLLRL